MSQPWRRYGTRPKLVESRDRPFHEALVLTSFTQTIFRRSFLQVLYVCLLEVQYKTNKTQIRALVRPSDEEIRYNRHPPCPNVRVSVWSRKLFSTAKRPRC